MKRMHFKDIPSNSFFSEGKDPFPSIHRIISDVKQEGDQALKYYTYLLDKVRIDDFEVKQVEIQRSTRSISSDLLNMINQSISNLQSFGAEQIKSLQEFEKEIQPGVYAGQKVIPIERIGIYVPGGRYPLFSSLLMAVIPAKIAGVKELIVCSPPDQQGHIHPLILAAAAVSGAERIFKIGGAQAIAAMAYGTASIPKVDKIVGPGNAYVNAAKKIVCGDTAIDFFAGPTEILIISDEHANPDFIAADLIAQAEHDLTSCPILLTNSISQADQVEIKLNAFINDPRTNSTAVSSLYENGYIILVDNWEQAVEYANLRAPEHLALFVCEPEIIVPKLKNFGTLFIGEWSPEVLGDYCCGINHILPTSGAARYTGGLSVRDFLKTQTTLRVNKKGFERMAPIAASLAKAEGLTGHAFSVEVRQSSLIVEG
ncbi:MAG: histidinol dehydrogenase [Candidatus Aminicenantes bacterium]|nr:histidinol dehydrogenase [Candidatus Aminicenantes bacterium]